MDLVYDDLIKLGMALLIGGVIGVERELRNKTAGLRTMTLITVGSTLFTMLSMRFVGGSDRVASTIVSGVGFLGAGSIMFLEGKVKGLTTASSIWVAAALGMAIGTGDYLLATVFAVAVLVVLWLFAWFDRWLGARSGELRHYEICYARPKKVKDIERMFDECGVRVRGRKQFKRGDQLIGQWDVDGKLADHDSVIALLISDKEIKELEY
jgi:putative Mg2+ transporter-C (MgtC) family protein